MKDMTDKTKIIIGILFIVIIALVIGGENSNNNSTTNPTVTETVTEQPTIEKPDSSYIDDETAYLNALESVDEEFYLTYSDADLLDLGWTICESLDAGLTVDDIIIIGLDAGMPETWLGLSIGASVATLCTEHYAYVDSWLNRNGY